MPRIVKVQVEPSAASSVNLNHHPTAEASVIRMALNLVFSLNGTVLQRRRWEKAHREGIEKGAGFNWRTVSSHSVTIRK
jgi:hypothetical protein